MKMKNMFVKSMMAVLLLSIGTMTVNAGRAHAFLLAATVVGDLPNEYRNGWERFNAQGRAEWLTLCIVFLPICLLDEKADGLPSLSKADLVNNGYTQDAADKIFTDTATLAGKLKETQQNIVIGNSDTLETVANGIRSIMPEASDEFVSFYYSNAR